MNQGIAFARTVRALEADDFRASKFGLVVAAVLIGAWVWWMLAARVPRYASTNDVRIEAGQAIAYFPLGTAVHAGQSAIVTHGDESIPARVESIDGERVQLVFSARPVTLTNASSASAEVEIARVSPASIALGVVGRKHP